MVVNVTYCSIDMSICANCNTHGCIENGIITVPCSSCALDNGYEWNGNRCYGVSGLSGGRESTLEELVMTYAILVRPRYIDNPDGLDGQTPDEYILNKFIPDEGKDIYKSMIATPLFH
jgi:hypothetical protein